MRILIIEDDPDILDFLVSSLAEESFAVDSAADGLQGYGLANLNEYDVIILDNALPNKSGFEICRDLRAEGRTTPILMLSVKTDAEEKALLLNAGADDYLGKPYSYAELIARIRALLRRPTLTQPTLLRAGSLSLNPASSEVHRGTESIYLTRKEFGLLELLLKNKGTVVSRGMILEHVWNVEGDLFSKTIETHILNLRRKIETDTEKFIISVSGRGYTID